MKNLVKLSILFLLVVISSCFCFKFPAVKAEDEIFTRSNFTDSRMFDALISYAVNNNLPTYNNEGFLKPDTFAGVTWLTISNANITSLADLTLFNWPLLQTIDASKNGITEIDNDLFAGFANLKYINLNENFLTNISNFGATGLIKIDAKSNQIINADLSGMQEGAGGYAEANLFDNKIDSVSAINLNSAVKYKLNLIYNNIYDVVTLSNYAPNLIDIYNQKVTDYLSFDNQTEILINGGYSMPNYHIRAVKDDLTYITIVPGTAKKLAIGTYDLKFYNGDSPLALTSGFSTISGVEVSPVMPLIKITDSKNKEYKTSDIITTKSTVTLTNQVANAKVYLSIDDGEYYEANSFVISEHKNYNLKVKLVYNNQEYIRSYTLVSQINPNVLSSGFMLVLIATVLMGGGLLWKRFGPRGE